MLIEQYLELLLFGSEIVNNLLIIRSFDLTIAPRHGAIQVVSLFSA